MTRKDDSAQPDTSKSEGGALALLAGLAIASSVLGRALAPALPGSLTGIATWIKVLDFVDSFLAQLFACFGLLLLLRLVGKALRGRTSDTLFKMAVLPITTLIVLLVVSRMRLDYSEPKSSLALALACSSLALAAAPRLIQSVRTRAAGLALALSGTLGLLHATGRALALQANLDALPGKFTLARAIETVAFSTGVLLLALAAFWILEKTRAGLFKFLGALAVGGLLSYAAIRGSGQDASLWEVLASRSMGYLLRDPSPFIPTFIRGMDVIVRVALSIIILMPKNRTATNVVFCLCLLSAGATDIPLLALALTLAALIAHTHGRAPLQKPSKAV